MGHDRRRAAPHLHRAAAACALSLALLAGCEPQPPVEHVHGAVGRIFCTLGDGLAVGSGFAVTPELIVTAAHVIHPDGQTCDPLEIAFDAGQPRALEVVAEDARRDLALLRVRGRTGPNVRLYGGYEPVDGSLTVVGFPIVADAVTADSAGYVKPTASPVHIEKIDHDADDTLVVQVEAGMNPGQSGGPALDACGRVAGVALRIRRGSAGEAGWVLHPRELLAFLEGREDTKGLSSVIETDRCQPERGPITLLLAVGVGLFVMLSLLMLGAASGNRRRAQEAGPPAEPRPPAPRGEPHPAPAGDAARRPEAPAPSIAPTAAVVWRLRFVSGPLINQAFELVDRIGIGRDPAFSGPFFPAGTTGVSREHLEARMNFGVVEVRDLGSSGGTTVGGQRIPAHQWITVDAGVTVTLGTDVSLVFEEI